MKKVQVIWLVDGKRHEKIFDSYEESKPFTEDLNEKGLLWVLTDKVEVRNDKTPPAYM